MTDPRTIPDDIMQAAQAALDRMPELHTPIQAGEFWALVEHEVATAIHDAIMAERERQWMPIGTAPKTGETIIVRLANGEVFSATWHVYGNPGWHVSSDIGFITPHHWMSLPAPPKAGGE